MKYLENVTKGIIDQNPVFRLVLGMCPTLAVTKSAENGLGMGMAATFVLLMSNVIIAALRKVIPRKVRIASFIVVIATFVVIVELLMQAYFYGLYQKLGIFLPLITVNCAILGASLFMIIREYTFFQSLGFGFGGGLGWTLAIILMAGLRQKMRYSNIPRQFEGVAIAMIITGIMAMTFMGFAGMVTIQ